MRLAQVRETPKVREKGKMMIDYCIQGKLVHASIGVRRGGRGREDKNEGIDKEKLTGDSNAEKEWEKREDYRQRG